GGVGAAGGAGILKQSASGHGGWNHDTGYGNLDVAAAVAKAQGTNVAVPSVDLGAVKVGLRALPARGKQTRLSGLFAPARKTVSRAGRRLGPESFDDRTCHRFATARTGKAGVATWTLALRRGSYRIRASFAGAHDLAPATSRSVTLRVRLPSTTSTRAPTSLNIS